RQYFKSLPIGGNGQPHVTRFRPSFRPRSIFNSAAGSAPPGAPAAVHAGNGAAPAADTDGMFRERVSRLVHAYRARGHLLAQLNPLGGERPERPELDPRSYGFSESDLQRIASTTVAGAEH